MKKKLWHYITWALEHWHYLIGLPKVKVETDHKPLVPLFTTKLIEELPLRIQRFRIQMMQFNITVEHAPGKLLFTADALSGGRGKSSPEKESYLETESDFFVTSVRRSTGRRRHKTIGMTTDTKLYKANSCHQETVSAYQICTQKTRVLK